MKQLYKEAKANLKNLIKNKKRDFYEEKLRESAGKLKEVKLNLKFLGLLSKVNPVFQISVKDGKNISFDEKASNNTFKIFYANLVLHLTPSSL